MANNPTFEDHISQRRILDGPARTKAIDEAANLHANRLVGKQIMVETSSNVTRPAEVLSVKPDIEIAGRRFGATSHIIKFLDGDKETKSVLLYRKKGGEGNGGMRFYLDPHAHGIELNVLHKKNGGRRTRKGKRKGARGRRRTVGRKKKRITKRHRRKKSRKRH